MRDIFWTVLAGFAGGIISPLLLAFLQQRVIWRTQKITEVKKSVFDEAMTAIAMYEVDVMDNTLQANAAVAEGLKSVTTFRAETKDQIQKTLAQVEAFFSDDAFKAFSNVLSSGMSLNSIPNREHYEKRTKAIRKLAVEIGLDQTIPWWKVW